LDSSKTGKNISKVPLLVDFTDDYYNDKSTEDYSSFPEPCNKEEVHRPMKVFQPCVLSIVFAIGIVGNVLVLVTYTRYRRLKSMTDIYLLNLALADLLLLITLPFIAIDTATGWIFGNVMCKLIQLIYAINVYGGLLFLTCISVDRYIVIVQATVAHRFRKKTKLYSIVASIIVWLVSSLFALPHVIYSRAEKRDEVYLCRMIFKDGNKTVTVTTATHLAQIVLGFIFPFSVMVICYSLIIRTLLQARSFEKHKALKVIFMVLFAFVLFQLPYSVVLFLENPSIFGKEMPCSTRKGKDFAFLVTSTLASIRCCLNPMLYAFIGVKFRRDVSLLMKDLGCITQEQYAKSAYSSTKRFSFISHTETATTLSF
uniref:C-C motif chemokine receptor 10 n=1 Tax=Latimeria chalumnae TaxID=7897 RepID=H3AUB3_LATCH